MVTADFSAEWGSSEYPKELKETLGCSERSGVQKRAGKDSVWQPEGAKWARLQRGLPQKDKTDRKGTERRKGPSSEDVCLSQARKCTEDEPQSPAWESTWPLKRKAVLAGMLKRAWKASAL